MLNGFKPNATCKEEDLGAFQRRICDELRALSAGHPLEFRWTYQEKIGELTLDCTGCKMYLLRFTVQRGRRLHAGKFMIRMQRAQLAQHLSEAAHAPGMLTTLERIEARRTKPKSKRAKSATSTGNTSKPGPILNQPLNNLGLQVANSLSAEERDGSGSADDGMQSGKHPNDLTTVAELPREERKGEDRYS